MAVERFGLDSRQPRDRAREQRRLPAPARRRARASRRSASSRPPTSPRSARERGIDTLVRVLRPRARATELAAEGRRADLLVANNVHGARAGPERLRRPAWSRCSRPAGVVTIEVPHLLRLVEDNQFDTIYHEHFSVLLVPDGPARCFAAHGLEVFDVDELKSHGGSLRLYAQRASDRQPARSSERVRDAGRARAGARLRHARGPPRRSRAQVEETKWSLLEFLIAQPARGQADRRLRRARQGQHAAQLLRHPHRPARVHGRPQPVQAGPVPAGHAHPDPAPRGARAGPARLHPDPALEPEGRDRRPARLRARVGRAVRRPDPGGGGPVKVVIFCGGQGLRMREASEVAPKPMIPIGNRPVLWHVMKYYAHFGFTDFVLCLGYKAEAIKHFFLTYSEAMANDFVLSDGGASVHLLKTDIHNWNITFVDTGLHASIGERLRAVRQLLARRRDVPRQLRRHAHRRGPAGDDRARQGRRRDGQLPRGPPNYSFHVVSMNDDGRVRRHQRRDEAPTSGSTAATSSCAREFLDQICGPARTWSRSRSSACSPRGELLAQRHEGFWAPMDTLKDKQWLESLHESGEAPWQLWDARPRRRRDLAASPPPADAAAVASGRPEAAPRAGARDRRPSRRHRDRLRRHDPQADRAGARSPRSAGSC